MAAALQREPLEGAPNLVEWLKLATPTVDRVARAELVDHSLPSSCGERQAR